MQYERSYAELLLILRTWVQNGIYQIGLQFLCHFHFYITQSPYGDNKTHYNVKMKFVGSAYSPLNTSMAVSANVEISVTVHASSLVKRI